MSEFDQAKAAIAFCIGAFFLLWGLRNIMRTNRIRHSGGVSLGTVVSSRDSGEDRYITVRFVTMHNREVRFEQLAPLFQKRQCRVFYDVAHPQRATISPWRDICVGLALTGFGAYFIYETHSAALAYLL